MSKTDKSSTSTKTTSLLIESSDVACHSRRISVATVTRKTQMPIRMLIRVQLPLRVHTNANANTIANAANHNLYILSEPFLP